MDYACTALIPKCIDHHFRFFQYFSKTDIVMFTTIVLFLLSIVISTESGRKHNTHNNLRPILRNINDRDNNFRLRDTVQEDEEIIPITVYYGSLCMDSRRFFTEQVTRAYELLGSHIDVRLIPYGKATTKIINDTINYYEFNCQSGPNECYGNKLHACALDLVGDKRQAVMFIACMMDEANTERGSNDDSADLCGHTLDVDSDAVKDCASDSKGVLLLNYYGEQSRMVRYTSIPHVIVDGEESDGVDFVRDVCNAFVNPPLACEL